MRTLIAFVAFAVVAGPSFAAEDKDSLDAALKKNAPNIIKYLREHKYQNVGVLKFVVQQDGATTDNAGPLNLSIANRMEVALVLANPDEKLGIIERASAAVVRAKNRRANHLSPEGRTALFQVREYTLPWGDRQQVEADAFVTGIVEISKEGRTMKVTVQAFDRQSKGLTTVCTFSAATDFRTLTETGRNYHLAGARGPDESELLVQAIDQSKTIQGQKEIHPLETGKSPIELKVIYNDTAVKIANGRVPEPGRDDRVRFSLTNRSNERLGVVLKVNGENTLFREPSEAFHCHKWILGPGENVKIDGFQMGPGGAKRFEVQSPEESEKDVVHYGEHAGTFNLVVFRETKIDKDIVPASFDTAAIARGTLAPNGRKPGTLTALQAMLKEKADKSKTDGQRGIVTPGEDISRPIQFVTFKADPVPLMAATVRYWQGK